MQMVHDSERRRLAERRWRTAANGAEDLVLWRRGVKNRSARNESWRI